jgi:hypothetical protein
MNADTFSCPGCALTLPMTDQVYDRKFNASAECWSVFEEVIAVEFQHPALFGRTHQLTVDSYAVQHAGGRHPDKSVCFHAVGLCRVLELGVAPTDVAPKLQRLAGRTTTWPHFEVPAVRAALTVQDVALAAGAVEEHVGRVRAWAAQLWESWREHHLAIRGIAGHL